MADKDINIHIRAKGAEDAKRQISGVAQTTGQVGDKAQETGSKSEQGFGKVKGALTALMGPLGFAGLFALLGAGARKVAAFFDDLARRAAMKEYMQNPVILASHTHRLADGRSPVVGKVIDYTFTGRDLVITVEFAQTELGEEYWRLYKDKFQRAFSIGFIGRSAPVAEVMDGRRVRVWKDIELLEISCVAVPANPAALSKQRLSWGQRKKNEREQKLLENPVRLERLFARYEKLRNEQIRTAGLGYCEDVSEEVLRKHFSDAEISMIHDVCRYDPAWGFGDPEELSFEEDYAKYI